MNRDPEQSDTTDTTDTAHRYRRLASRFTELIDAVPADRWSAASPCDGWTAADIVEHVAATQREFLQRHEFAPDDLATDWPTVRTLMQATLDDPDRAGLEFDGYFGPTSFAATVADFYCTDLVVHAWDVAIAAGVDDFATIDPDEMMRIQAGLAPMEDAMRQPGLFGDHLDVPDDADDQTRFLAFIGRANPKN